MQIIPKTLKQKMYFMILQEENVIFRQKHYVYGYKNRIEFHMRIEFQMYIKYLVRVLNKSKFMLNFRKKPQYLLYLDLGQKPL